MKKRKANYKKRRKNQEAMLMKAAKLATLGELSANIAHEIKNPLTIINSKVSSLLKAVDVQTGYTCVHSSDLQLIKDTTLRIDKIVKGLKSFSRSGEGDPFEIVLLIDIAMECFNLCEEKFKSAGVEFRVDVPKNLYFECRFVQLFQALINLANNAFDAVQDTDEKWVELKARKLDDQKHFEIIITDGGMGIPEKIAKQLMTPFFTTKGRDQGTGLGLSISKKIVEAHQGEIYLDRNSAHTKFVIRLPYNQAVTSIGDKSGSQAA